MTKKIVLISVLALALAGQVLSQTRTGVLTGRVTDDQGEVLPGVGVTISGPALIEGKQAVTTSDHGLYRFINLPPGVYTLRAEIQSFQPFERAEVRVRLGLTTTLDFQMNPGAVTAEVQVVASTPAVDIESNRLSTNFGSEVLAKLPSERNLEAFLKLTPGAVVDFGADPKYPERSVFGSGARENYYSMDGTYLTDPGAGSQMIYWNYDIIEEAQVEGTAHDAQYGNSAGAVINIVTKSGGDRLNGKGNVFFRDKSMRATNHEGTGLDGPSTAIKKEWEGSLNLGGPVLKEKLWFFLSGSFIPTLMETAGFPEDIDRKQYYGFGKMTAQLGLKHKLSFIYNYSRDKQNHMFASQFRTPQSTLNSRQWTSAFNLQWNYMMSSNALLEVRGAFVDRATTYNSNGPGPCYYELTTGVQTKSAGFHNEQTRQRYQFQSALSYWLEGFGGDHDLKTGVEFEQGESGYDGTSQSDYPGGPSFIYTWDGEVMMYEIDDPARTISNNIFRAFSWYGQDTWKIGTRLNLNVGVRLNHVQSIIPKQDKVSEPITEFKFTNLEPRLGLVYDLSSGGRQMAVKAHYGRYFMNSMALGLVNPNGQTYYFYYIIGGEPYLIDVSGPESVEVDPDLKRPYSDTIVLGFEMSLAKNLAFKIDGVYKKSKNFIGTIDLARTAEWYTPVTVDNPIAGGTMTVYDLSLDAPLGIPYYTNPSQATRTYKAIQFVLEKNLSDNYQFLLSYTLSRAEGLVPLSVWGSGGMTAGSGWNNPNMYINTKGALDLDRTHQVKFSGVYYAPFGVIFGISYIGMSGAPYNRYFDVNLSTGPSSFAGETPGTKRAPFQHMIDVRVEKTFRAGKVSPSVFLEAFNLLNSNTALGYGTLLGSPTYEQITSILPPRILRIGVGVEF